MPSETTDTTEQHWERGVAEDSEVYCPEAGTTFGPGGESECSEYCLYCGEDTGNDAHQVHEYDTFCENSTMSTLRFCPYCGERIDRNVWPDSDSTGGTDGGE